MKEMRFMTEKIRWETDYEYMKHAGEKDKS